MSSNPQTMCGIGCGQIGGFATELPRLQLSENGQQEALYPSMFVKLWIDQQDAARWFDLTVSDIPPGVRKVLMPHYRYSEGMFFYEEYRFPLQVTHPVSNEKVVAALEECAQHVEKVISAYRTFSRFKRSWLLFRSVLMDYIDVISTGAKQPIVEDASNLPMGSHCLQ